MGPLKYGAPTSCGVRFCAYADGIVVAIRTMTCCARHLSLPASTPLELPPGDGVRYGSGLTQAAGVRRSAGVCAVPYSDERLHQPSASAYSTAMAG